MHFFFLYDKKAVLADLGHFWPKNGQKWFKWLDFFFKIACRNEPNPFKAVQSLKM